MTRILFADPSPTLALGLQVALEKRGLSVDTVCDGYLAFLRLQLGLADVCVLDTQLTTLDSLSILRKARASGVTMPIMVLTSSETSAGRVTWFDAGADDLIFKPFDTDEFVARVRSLHQRSQGRCESRIEFGPLIYDLLSDSFTLNEELLAFTPKEHAFVKCLISRPGYMTPKDRVFRSVFGDTVVGYGAMDVLACRVRRKLAGSGVFVSTVRGMGYLLMKDRSPKMATPIFQ